LEIFIPLIIITLIGNCHLFSHYLVWVDQFTIKLPIYMILKGGGNYTRKVSKNCSKAAFAACSKEIKIFSVLGLSVTA
jgi:hypothetical protein